MVIAFTVQLFKSNKFARENKDVALTLSLFLYIIFPIISAFMNGTFSNRVDLIFPGGHSEEETPVSIPNTEVKLLSADGTAGIPLWESRTLPGFLR